MMLPLRRRLLALIATVSLASPLLPAYAQDAAPRVLLETSMGDIVVELQPAKAPVTVENFVGYVKSGHYDGTIFHRVIDGFMIQGGGFDAKMNEKPTGSPIRNEAANGLKNERYTIAMARTSAPHSATAQFFLNVGDNTFLDHPSRDGWGYAVFGRVIKGMDVVDRIRAVSTTSRNGHRDVPVEPVVIRSAKIAS
jgi:cyclophilin family peptidyl-prolyl cis-trans isomerase